VTGKSFNKNTALLRRYKF